jgi:nanoRNase/pAp phosphatase (c-di-AMP/oligoRNAs hydrolase)
MNNQNLDFSPLQQSLQQSNSVLILLPQTHTIDKVASALGLYLSLKKSNKAISIASPQSMTVAYNRLIGVNKISNSLGNKNLVISFDYLKDSIEKVSYNIKNNKFNLVVEPKPGKPSLDPNKVSYSHTGTEADLIIVIGAKKQEDLGQFYQENRSIFTNKTVVNIDNSQGNSQFGQINFHNNQSGSIAQIIVDLIKKLNLLLDQDISTNLYAGLQAGTNNFNSFKVNAQVFEQAAWLLNNGAKKGLIGQTQTTKPNIKSKPAHQQPQQVAMPQNNKTSPPPDWFKPKIYKGNTKI